jgi:hypothetical protein
MAINDPTNFCPAVPIREILRAYPNPLQALISTTPTKLIESTQLHHLCLFIILQKHLYMAGNYKHAFYKEHKQGLSTSLSLSFWFVEDFYEL